MPVLRPRMSMKLTVPYTGTPSEKNAQDSTDDTISFFVPVRRARLESNDHTAADTLDVTVDFRDAGTDVRMLSDATCQFYMGFAGAGNQWVPAPADLRFVGVMKKPSRHGDAGGMTVDLLFHDYTAFFLDAKKFPSAGVPPYSLTISQAWRLICDTTGPISRLDGMVHSSVQALRDNLVFEGATEDLVLGTAVGARFRKYGKVQVDDKMDAWAVWQQCVGALGLISYIKLDQCIVTTATDYYTQDDPPRFVWGTNILSMSEDRDSRVSNAGIIVQSFDPLTGTQLEALYPPLGSSAIQRKKVKASKKHAVTENALLNAEKREVFAYPSVTDQNRLEEIAKRIYEERSRQDLEGRLTTCERSVKTLAGDDYELLGLAAGDQIRVEIDPFDKETLKKFGDDMAAADYLVGRGYSANVAELLVRNMKAYASLPPAMLVKRVNTTLESTKDGGTYSIEIQYCNKINIDGSSIAGDAP